MEERNKTITGEAVKDALVEYREPLNEMARVDNPQKDSIILGTKEVCVYGQDRSSMSPHFHYFDKRGSHQFHVEVKIDDLTICQSQPRKGIPENQLTTWNGLTDAKKALFLWLESPNSDIPTETNYKMLKVAWNQNNRDNQIET